MPGGTDAQPLTRADDCYGYGFLDERRPVDCEPVAQIRALVTLGADVVGMTVSGEALLLAERDRPLVALALSSNHAAGMDPRGEDVGIDHHEIDDQAERMAAVVRNAAFALLDHL